MKFFNFFTSLKKVLLLNIFIAFLILVSLITGIFFLYKDTKVVLKEQLFNSLNSVVSSYVRDIDYRDVEKLSNPEMYTSDEYKRVVSTLSKIVNYYPEVSFAYIEKIQKNKEGSEEVVFLADGWSLNPYANTDSDNTNNIDINRDGLISEDDELTYITEIYENAPIKSIKEGYKNIYIDNTFHADEWGRFITGYAPIKNDIGETVAVLAVDIRDVTFDKILGNISQLFFIFSLVVLGSVLILLSLFLVVFIKKENLNKTLDEEKSLVIGLVGHEMKTPLARIRWLLSAAREELANGDPKVNKHIKEAYDESVKGSDFSKIILDVSRIQFGKLKLNFEKIELNTMVQDIREDVEFMFREKNVLFKNEVPGIIFSADPYYFLLALKNIISNAIKYSHDGGEVVVSAKENKDTLEISVTDSGIGIPKEEREKILSGFYRAMNTKETTGHGLGMYLAYQIIKHHEGELEIYSEEGKGSRFTIVIPKK